MVISYSNDQTKQLASQQDYRRYPIFLSSLCEELRDLREQIFYEVGKEKSVYIDEKVIERDIQRQDDVEAVDELIHRIREARVFISILGGSRHGTLIRVGECHSSVSFFEVELFQAAILQKPVHLFVRDDFQPEPRLRKLIEILDFYLPEWICRKRLTNKEIVDQVRRLVQQDRLTSPFRSIRHLYQPIRRLVQGFYTARGRPTANRGIRFLEGEFEARAQPPNRDVLDNVVKLIHAQPNEEKRLTRSWLGLRELMALPYTTPLSLELLKYWDKLLGEWAKAGAWYGLHGDTPL